MAQWVDIEAEKITHWAHVGARPPYLRLIRDYWFVRKSKKHEGDAWFLFSNASMSTHWAIRRITSTSPFPDKKNLCFIVSDFVPEIVTLAFDWMHTKTLSTVCNFLHKEPFYWIYTITFDKSLISNTTPERSLIFTPFDLNIECH